MTFGILALVALVSILGPLLGARVSWHVPVVVGELAAGVVFGVTGFGLLDSSDRTFTFLADIGFALTMMVAYHTSRSAIRQFVRQSARVPFARLSSGSCRLLLTTVRRRHSAPVTPRCTRS